MRGQSILRASLAALTLWFWCSSAAAQDGTLVIANRTGGSISFIDLPTGVEIARVPIGPIIPHEVAVSPDGRHAVATMQESDRLALVDLEARTVLRTYATGGRDGHMVRLSPDGSRAYVTSRGAEGTLSVIFLEEDRAPVTIGTGLGAEGLDVSADGSEIWVANRREETISVIDSESLEVVATLDSRPFSGRIEMGPDGHAIVPNGGGSAAPVERYVRLWDVSSRTLIAEVPLPGEPFEGNFGALIHDGMALVADPGEGLINVFDLDGLSSHRVLIDNHDAPDGMAWTPVRVVVMNRD